MYRDWDTQGRKQAFSPCNLRSTRRRNEYERRAAELKKELTKQRMVFNSKNQCRPATAGVVLDIPSTVTGPDRVKMARQKYSVGSKVLTKSKSIPRVGTANRQTKGNIYRGKFLHPKASSTVIERTYLRPKSGCKPKAGASTLKSCAPNKSEGYQQNSSLAGGTSPKTCESPRRRDASPIEPAPPCEPITYRPKSPRKPAEDYQPMPGTSTGHYTYTNFSISSEDLYAPPSPPIRVTYPTKAKTAKNRYGKTVYCPTYSSTTGQVPQTSDDSRDHCKQKKRDKREYPDVASILESCDPCQNLPIPDELLPTREDYEHPSAALSKLEKFFKFIDNVEQQIGEHAVKHNYSYGSLLESNKEKDFSESNVSNYRQDYQITQSTVSQDLNCQKPIRQKTQSMKKGNVHPRGKTQTGVKRGSSSARGMPVARGGTRTKGGRQPTGRVCSERNQKGKSFSYKSSLEKIKERSIEHEERKCFDQIGRPPLVNPIIETAQRMINKMIPCPVVTDIRYTMLYTCLEWALSQCPDPNNIPPETKMINAIMDWEEEVERLTKAGEKPETIIIRPGEIDPASVTVINVQTQTEVCPVRTPPPVFRPPSPRPQYQLDSRYAEHSILSPECSPREIPPMEMDVCPPRPELHQYSYQPPKVRSRPKPEIFLRRMAQLRGRRGAYVQQDLVESDSTSSECPDPGMEDNVLDDDLAWLRRIEENDDIEFEVEVEDFDALPEPELQNFLIPETRVISAVPTAENPRVAQLDMQSVQVIRNPEQYMEPLNESVSAQACTAEV
ncbi:uncharacterized protein LOC106669923 [Cimex lectularius]|uniref:Uncharacterized protein n=1 Tax=Cimex lectularius TaxID=79782 RepID=A0A8I6S1A0_CIMLE|nr:uncharacterized protein LOC106669923 [Cimex lectularius]